MPETLFLSVGGNLGDRAGHLRKAVALLGERLGPLRQVSPFYETEAWGVRDQPAFLNACLSVETELTPEAAIEACLSVEADLGRERRERWHARTMDVDMLYYGNRVLRSEGLTVPHPRLAERRFVLVPLADLECVPPHPLTGKTVAEMLADCPDALEVKPFRSEEGPLRL